jgi:hypothetical protein
MTQKKLFKVLTLAAFVAMVAISPLQATEGCQEKASCEKTKAEGCEKVKAEGCEKVKAEGCEKVKAEGCMMLKQIPNLSDEQKGKLEKLHAEHQKMMAAAMAEMQKKCQAHREAVQALLTPEQKAKLGEMGCGMMMGGMEHKGGCQMKHGMKMEKKKCSMAKEEEKK